MESVKIILTPERKKNYDKETKTFTVSEVGIAFSMNYTLLNPVTGESREFELSHSTGNEFDPDTEWIYKSDDGLTLRVVQDTKLTEMRGENYLTHKTRNSYGI